MHKCKFLDWKSGDLPEPSVYKPRLKAKYYGREELSSRQKRQIDVMAGYHGPIWQPMPDWIHRDTGKTYNSKWDRMHERIGKSLFYNKNKGK